MRGHLIFVLMQVRLVFQMGLVFGKVQNCFSKEVLVNFVVRFRVQIQTDFLVFFCYLCQGVWLCICQGRLCIFIQVVL